MCTNINNNNTRFKCHQSRIQVFFVKKYLAKTFIYICIKYPNFDLIKNPEHKFREIKKESCCMSVNVHLWSDVGDKDGVDAAKLDVDLETEVGQGLRRGLVHVLSLWEPNH